MHSEPLSYADALQELARSKQRLLLLQNILESPHGVIFFSLDAEYRYTSFARAHAETMQHIWGVTIEIGTCMLDVITNEADRQKAKANFDAALSGENILKEEEYGDAELHRTFWENRYSPLRDASGRITGLTVFVTDITARREAAEQLAKAQEELRVSLETQLKQLSGIIPICSYCKKIRADDESWHQLEAYISAHSEAMFSHGMCPTCFENWEQVMDAK